MKLPERIGDWPEFWREDYEERAAILEYCAMMPRDAAEKEAEGIVRAKAEMATDAADPV